MENSGPFNAASSSSTGTWPRARRQGAFFYEDTSLTYGAMAELVNRAGNALLDLGVQAGTACAPCLLLDSLEFVARLGAASRRHPIPVNTMLRADDYLYFLEDSRARGG